MTDRTRSDAALRCTKCDNQAKYHVWYTRCGNLYHSLCTSCTQAEFTAIDDDYQVACVRLIKERTE